MHSKNLTEDNWQQYLAQRLGSAWSTVSSAKHGPPPFQAEKHKEAEAYAALPTSSRCVYVCVCVYAKSLEG